MNIINGGIKMALNFKEYPRGGASNGPIENGGEIHLPCVVLVDTSTSMSEAMGELHDGLVALGEALKDDPQALGRVEFCIISFDDQARIVVPFAPAYDYEAPRLDCGGMTAMHAAVDLALEEIEARKDQYKANHTAFLRPWIFMMTDGGANDPDNGAFDRLLQSQRDKHCIFFPVGIGSEVDMGLLKSLKPDGVVLTAKKENFKGAFEWLSNSLSSTSDSNPGQKIKLPNPSTADII